MPMGAAAIARNGWATVQYGSWLALLLPARLRYQLLAIRDSWGCL
jgi:hypothetical protein